MEDYPYDDLKLPAREVIVYSNLDDRQAAKIKIKSNITFKDLSEEIIKKLKFKNVQTFRLFDSSGIEMFSNDLELIKSAVGLYASEGDDFNQDTKFSEYRIIRELGRGGYGKVMLATHKQTNRNVALKIVNLDKDGSVKDMDRIFAEAEMLKALAHPHIVKILNFYSLSSMEFVFVMEYLEGGELGAYLRDKGSLSEEEAKHFFKQLLCAIDYCHNEKLIHRDLKLENILLENQKSMNIKVVDFGIAGVVSSLKSDPTEAGSLMYLAPEVLSGRDLDACPALDVWSMGCILYALLHGKPAFGGKTRKGIAAKIMCGEYSIDEQVIKRSSLELIDLLQKMLTVDNGKRITIPEILKHPWITKDNLAPCKKDAVEAVKEEKKMPEKEQKMPDKEQKISEKERFSIGSEPNSADKKKSVSNLTMQKFSPIRHAKSESTGSSPSSNSIRTNVSDPFVGRMDLANFLRKDNKDIHGSKKSMFFNT